MSKQSQEDLYMGTTGNPTTTITGNYSASFVEWLKRKADLADELKQNLGMMVKRYCQLVRRHTTENPDDNICVMTAREILAKADKGEG